jgi:hypothetical protein
MAMPNRQTIGLNNDQTKTFDEYLEDDKLITAMEIEFTHGQKFVDVATCFGLSRYASRRKLQSFGWGRLP